MLMSSVFFLWAQILWAGFLEELVTLGGVDSIDLRVSTRLVFRVHNGMYMEARGLWLSSQFAQPLHQLLLDIFCEVV